MYLTGFTDEAGNDLDTQIKATKELGWKFIEARKIGDKNLASLDDAGFDQLQAKLDEAGIKINCYGSGVANWATSITKSPESSYEEMRKAGPRMNKLGIKMVRVMSFPVPEEDYADNAKYYDEVVQRMKEITRVAADHDVICVHENCSGWGGLSYEHTLRLVEGVNSPNFKLVYDTGNPVSHPDVRGPAPYKKQSSWEFYQAVKDHVSYVHIKDARPEGDSHVFTFAGDGDGDVKRIVEDLLKNGYDGGFSMEPHMKVLAHDSSVKAEASAQYDNYIEYGRRFEKLLEDVKKEL